VLELVLEPHAARPSDTASARQQRAMRMVLGLAIERSDPAGGGLHPGDDLIYVLRERDQAKVLG
jgi:hypothetical protein